MDPGGAPAPQAMLVLSSRGCPFTAVMVVDGPKGVMEGGVDAMKSVTCSGGVRGYSKGLLLQSGGVGAPAALCFKWVRVVVVVALPGCCCCC